MRYLVFSMFLLLGCRQGIQHADANRVTTAAPNLTNDVLSPLYDEVSKLGRTRSLLVWQEGELLGEAYYKDYQSQPLDHLRSVTKSIMGLLIGIAVDRGHIASIDDPIDRYIGDQIANYDSAKRQLTIRHFLTMTTGFQWNEDDGYLDDFNRWARSDDPLQFLMSRPLANEPGSTFRYNSGGSHVLSIILTEATGMSTLEFAKRFLFGPLGIENLMWGRRKDGYYTGAASLQLAPRDLLKIGVLMVQGGVYDDTRIVSEQWVMEATKAHVQLSPADSTYYGFQWWVQGIDGLQLIQAKGYGGQYLGYVPERQLVFCITSDWQYSWDEMLAYLQALDEVMQEVGVEVLLGIKE